MSGIIKRVRALLCVLHKRFVIQNRDLAHGARRLPFLQHEAPYIMSVGLLLFAER